MKSIPHLDVLRRINENSPGECNVNIILLRIVHHLEADKTDGMKHVQRMKIMHRYFAINAVCYCCIKVSGIRSFPAQTAAQSSWSIAVLPEYSKRSILDSERPIQVPVLAGTQHIKRGSL